MPSRPDSAALLLVPDVRSERGLGHLQRTLALGEAWLASGGRVVALLPEHCGDAQDRVRAAGGRALAAGSGPIVTPEAVVDAAGGSAWCVFDGYDFGSDHHRAARSAAPVAVIDDHGRTGAVEIDVVIDHNLGATCAPYRATGARVLAGSRYTLLRAEHLAPGPVEDPERLVVVMGGAPEPATVAFVSGVLAGLEVPSDRIDLVGLHPTAGGVGGGHRLIDRAASLAPVFRSARVALSAAGSTTWELARAGTANVLLAVAANQEPIGEAAAEIGMARYLGPLRATTPRHALDIVHELWSDTETIRAMSARGQAAVDGQGAARVVDALLAIGRGDRSG